MPCLRGRLELLALLKIIAGCCEFAGLGYLDKLALMSPRYTKADRFATSITTFRLERLATFVTADNCAVQIDFTPELEDLFK